MTPWTARALAAVALLTSVLARPPLVLLGQEEEVDPSVDFSDETPALFQEQLPIAIVGLRLAPSRAGRDISQVQWVEIDVLDANEQLVGNLFTDARALDLDADVLEQVKAQIGWAESGAEWGAELGPQERRSFIHVPDRAAAQLARIDLHVPIGPNDFAVWACPFALTLVDVSLDCPDGYVFNDPARLGTATLENVDYWVLMGVQSIGAEGLQRSSPASAPTPTATPTLSPTAVPGGGGGGPSATDTPTATATAVPTITATPTQAPITAGQYSSLILDATGNPVVSYLDATNNDLRLLHCGNPTCTEGNSIVSPDTVGSPGFYTSIALDSAGNPVVSYWVDFSDLKVLHCGNPNCTAGNSLVSPDTVGSVGRYASLVLDGSGNPVVSYYDESNRWLKLLHCGNPNCTAGNSIAAPDILGDVGRYTSIKLDSTGNPVVSYRDQSNLDLKLLHCGDPNCTAGNSFVAVDTVGDVGVYTSLALDSSGNPVIAYLDAGTQDLKVAHCGNPNCTAGNSLVSADTFGDVGITPSLALDALGNPVVSYRDSTNGALKVLHCGNPNCTAGNSMAAADPSGGEHTSLKLDLSGNPVMSHYDVNTGDLKVVHCGDANCTSGNVITPIE